LFKEPQVLLMLKT